jgi:hypothetical protein
LKHPAVIAGIAELDECIQRKLGDKVKDKDIDPLLTSLEPDVADDDPFEDAADLNNLDIVPMEPIDANTIPDEHRSPEAFDEYISASILLPQGGEQKKATVMRRRINPETGFPVGVHNSNPILDTREYEVQFPDGSTDTFTANLIAENLYAQVDDEGRSYQVMREIIDHRTNGHALSKDNGFTVSGRTGVRRPKITTRGWELCVEWKDGTSTWVPLKDLKESNPVEIAEYAIANQIAEEPAFAWWVRSVLRKRERIIAKVKTRYHCRTHKYGVQLPKTVREAMEIDRLTGTTFSKM